MIDEFAKDYLHADLQEARESVLWKLEGLDEYSVRRPMTRTGTNLLGLVKHLTMTEARYFGEVFGRGVSEELPWNTPGAEPGTDKWATADESRADVVARYRWICAHSDETIRELPIDATGEVPHWPQPDVKLFNIMVHVLSDTLRHAGHADILRENLDGAVGLDAANAVALDRGDDYWANHCTKIERAAQAARRRPS